MGSSGLENLTPASVDLVGVRELAFPFVFEPLIFVLTDAVSTRRFRASGRTNASAPTFFVARSMSLFATGLTLLLLRGRGLR